ncbi:hypothetical protein PHLGIDRAFT_265734 [Phlebiopsis gigantea 11061_1 CR5-6]|uniref:Uncharacterized protein n=1 Tax=Phlebiopsis gigantea (strain 11061_1 CR5-6) TaxID=745531 RepID=A0A0C3S3P3_PHLG1|nr:hypothetical protein PHLGIDRAFT_265734 [Phlebiopsis gigantea 11061_1 CR5-6]
MAPVAAAPPPAYAVRPRTALGYREARVGAGYPGAGCGYGQGYGGGGYGGVYGQGGGHYYDPRFAGQTGFGYGPQAGMMGGGVGARMGGAGAGTVGAGYGAGAGACATGPGGAAMGMGGGAPGGASYDPSLAQRIAGDVQMVVGYSRGDPAMVERGQQKRMGMLPAVTGPRRHEHGDPYTGGGGSYHQRHRRY